MNGTTTTTFLPNTGTSRAMLVTILWRFEGSLSMGEDKSGTFSDVPEYEGYNCTAIILKSLGTELNKIRVKGNENIDDINW